MQTRLPLKSIFGGIVLTAGALYLGRYLGNRDEQNVIAHHGVRLAMSEADVLRSLGEPAKRLRDSPTHEIWGYPGERAVEFSHGIVVNSIGFGKSSTPPGATPASPLPSATPP